jgi:hypothetical protein
VIPLQGPNSISGYQVNPVADMGLSTSLASGGSDTGAGILVGVPATVLLYVAGASGQQVYRLKTGATADIDMSSGGQTMTIVNTNQSAVAVTTDTSSNAYFRVRVTDSNWSSAVTTFLCLTLFGGVQTAAYSVHNAQVFGVALNGSPAQ